MSRKINEKRAAALYNLRKEKGYTQQQVADGIRVSKQAISKFEQGIAFSIETATRLAHFFDVEYDYFIKQSKTESTISKANQEKLRIAKMEATIQSLENRISVLENKLLQLNQK